MQRHETVLWLSDPMLRAACDLARARDQTVGQVVRDALAAELRRACRKQRGASRLAPVRARIARDLADAANWSDLILRLRARGYELRSSGGGLALFSGANGERICKASDLGPGYGALMRRFGGPFPGDRHRQVVDRLLLPGPVPVLAQVGEEQEVIDF